MNVKEEQRLACHRIWLRRKNAITDVNAAIALMLDKPAIIKRPILVSSDNRFMVGFNANDYLLTLRGGFTFLCPALLLNLHNNLFLDPSVSP